MRIAKLGMIALGAALLGAIAAQGEQHEAAEIAAEIEKGADREIVVAEKVPLRGKVVAIDRDERTLTIDGNAGRLEIAAPEQAANFDRIQVGDSVSAVYYESVALAIHPVEGHPGAAEVAAVALAPPGGTPGGVIVDTVVVEAVVRSVDRETRRVTLEVPESETVTLKARPGVDLSDVKVGQQVIATHTEALAIRIDRPGDTPPVASPPASAP